MDDFGTFQAIERAILSDSQLENKITAVIIETWPGIEPPYLMVHFKKSRTNALYSIQGALVECDLTVISTYAGEQEIQELMSRIDFLLQTSPHTVQPRLLDLEGRAVFKRVNEKVEKNGSVRKGTLSYQIKVTMIREDNDE